MKTIVQTDEYQLVALDDFGKNARMKQVFHGLVQPNRRAQLAEKLLSHFGVVAAVPDGNDDAGRQQLALMHPLDVVRRACDIADYFYDAIKERDWEIAVPTMLEIKKIYDGETETDSDKD